MISVSERIPILIIALIEAGESADLTTVVDAVGPAGGDAGIVQRRQKECGENCDDLY